MNTTLKQNAPILFLAAIVLLALYSAGQLIHLGVVAAQTHSVKRAAMEWATSESDVLPDDKQESQEAVVPPVDLETTAGLQSEVTTKPLAAAEEKTKPPVKTPPAAEAKKEPDKFAAIVDRSIFGKAPAKNAQDAKLTGIFGDMALINGKWMKVGESVGKENLAEISKHKVILEEDGKKREVLLFAPSKIVATPAPPPKPEAKSTPKPEEVKPVAEEQVEAEPQALDPLEIIRQKIRALLDSNPTREELMAGLKEIQELAKQYNLTEEQLRPLIEEFMDEIKALLGA